MCGFLLTAASHGSYGQSIELRGKDTVAVIPIKSIRQANVRLVELQECKEERDSLFSQVRTYSGMVANQQWTIADLKNVIALDASLIADKKKISDLTDQQLKKDERRIRLLKVERLGLAGAVAVLVVKIVLHP